MLLRSHQARQTCPGDLTGLQQYSCPAVSPAICSCSIVHMSTQVPEQGAAKLLALTQALPAGLTLEPAAAERTLTHTGCHLLQRFSVIVSELVLVTAVLYMTR